MSFKYAYEKLAIQNDSASDVLVLLQKTAADNPILFTFTEKISCYLKLITADKDMRDCDKQLAKKKILNLIDRTYEVLLKISLRSNREKITPSLSMDLNAKINKKSKAWKTFHKKATKYLKERVYEENEPEFNIIYDLLDLEIILHSVKRTGTDNRAFSKTAETEITDNVYRFISNFHLLFISDSSFSDQYSNDNSEEWYSANEHVNPNQKNSEYFDTNNTTYCYCGGPYFGKMIGCDNEDCPIEWFHFDCVSLKDTPKDKWYCRECLKKKKE